MSQLQKMQGLMTLKQSPLSKLCDKHCESQEGSLTNQPLIQLKPQSKKQKEQKYVKEQKEQKDDKDYLIEKLNWKIIQLNNQNVELNKRNQQIINELEHEQRKLYRASSQRYSDNNYNAGLAFGLLDEKSYAIKKKQNEKQSSNFSSGLNIMSYLNDKTEQNGKTKNNFINQTFKLQNDSKIDSFESQSNLTFKISKISDNTLICGAQLEKVMQHTEVLKDSTINKCQYYRLYQDQVKAIKRSQELSKQTIAGLQLQNKNLQSQNANLQLQNANLKSQNTNLQLQKSNLQLSNKNLQLSKQKIAIKNINNAKIIQRAYKLLKETLQKFNIICPFEQQNMQDAQEQQLQNIQNPKDQDRSMVEDFQKIISIYNENLASIVKTYKQNKLFKQGIKLFASFKEQNGLVDEQRQILVQQVQKIIKHQQNKFKNCQHNNKFQQQTLEKIQQRPFVNKKSHQSQIEGFDKISKKNINISTESLTQLQTLMKDWMASSQIKKGQIFSQLQFQRNQSIDPIMMNLYLKLRFINMQHANVIAEKTKTIQDQRKAILKNGQIINDKINEIERMQMIIQSQNKTIESQQQQKSKYMVKLNKYKKYSQILTRISFDSQKQNYSEQQNGYFQEHQEYQRQINDSNNQSLNMNSNTNISENNLSAEITNDNIQQVAIQNGQQQLPKQQTIYMNAQCDNKKSINQTQLTVASQNISRISNSSQNQCMQKDDENQMRKINSQIYNKTKQQRIQSQGQINSQKQIKIQTTHISKTQNAQKDVYIFQASNLKTDTTSQTQKEVPIQTSERKYQIIQLQEDY